MRETLGPCQALADTLLASEKFTFPTPTRHEELKALSQKGWVTYVTGLFFAAFGKTDLSKETLRAQILGIVKTFRTAGHDLDLLPAALKHNIEQAFKLRAVRA